MKFIYKNKFSLIINNNYSNKNISEFGNIVLHEAKMKKATIINNNKLSFN